MCLIKGLVSSMYNLKISTRLAIFSGFFSLLLVLIGSIGLWSVYINNLSLKTVYEDRVIPLIQLGSINSLLIENRLVATEMRFEQNKETLKAHGIEVSDNIKKINFIWAAYKSTYLTPEEEKLASSFEANYKKLSEKFLLPVEDVLNKGNFVELQSLFLAQDKSVHSATDIDIHDLINLQKDVARDEYETAVARYKKNFVLSLGFVLIGLAIATVFGISLIRGIASSLKKAIHISKSVASGDLSQKIEIKGNDEITQVLRALVDMQDSLRNVVLDVRENAESVASASAQIAQGNSDLASRTERQASSLEETSSSMQQVIMGITQNSINAQQADQLSKDASVVATQGGQSVENVVETMRDINQSSQRISDIIGVIDSIAFQTNILALNASVEAARAGEQGRGFAVVASEVRNLAVRSADAAKEIKDLITANVARVGLGTQQVDEAGSTMQEVVNSIRRVTQIMDEITTVGVQQNSGVQHVGDVLVHMDQSTQQNAALVEEMAAAASSLRDQAQRLVGAVGIFKV